MIRATRWVGVRASSNGRESLDMQTARANRIDSQAAARSLNDQEKDCECPFVRTALVSIQEIEI